MPHARTVRQALVAGLLTSCVAFASSSAQQSHAMPDFVLGEQERQEFNTIRTYPFERRDEVFSWSVDYLAEAERRFRELEAHPAMKGTIALQGFGTVMRATQAQLADLKSADESQWVARQRVFTDMVVDLERLGAQLSQRVQASPAKQ